MKVQFIYVFYLNLDDTCRRHIHCSLLGKYNLYIHTSLHLYNLGIFQLFQAIEMHDINDIFISSMYVFAHFLYVFWVNYFGQILVDHSESVFEET